MQRRIESSTGEDRQAHRPARTWVQFISQPVEVHREKDHGSSGGSSRRRAHDRARSECDGDRSSLVVAPVAFLVRHERRALRVAMVFAGIAAALALAELVKA